MSWMNLRIPFFWIGYEEKYVPSEKHNESDNFDYRKKKKTAPRPTLQIWLDSLT